MRDRQRPQSEGDAIPCVVAFPPGGPDKHWLKPQAVALLKTHIYHTAPVTHLTVPNLKQTDTVRAVFDPNGDLNKPPHQFCFGGAGRGTFYPNASWTQDMGWDFEVGSKSTQCGFLRAYVILYTKKKATARASDGTNATTEKMGAGSGCSDD